MKILEFHTRIKTTLEIFRNPCENHENHGTHRIKRENYETKNISTEKIMPCGGSNPRLFTQS